MVYFVKNDCLSNRSRFYCDWLTNVRPRALLHPHWLDVTLLHHRQLGLLNFIYTSEYLEHMMRLFCWSLNKTVADLTVFYPASGWPSFWYRTVDFCVHQFYSVSLSDNYHWCLSSACASKVALIPWQQTVTWKSRSVALMKGVSSWIAFLGSWSTINSSARRRTTEFITDFKHAG